MKAKQEKAPKPRPKGIEKVIITYENHPEEVFTDVAWIASDGGALCIDHNEPIDGETRYVTMFIPLRRIHHAIAVRGEAAPMLDTED